MMECGCACKSDDCALAARAIRGAVCTDRLINESHFIVSIIRCGRCAQLFVKLFCERVDWADGDDPQARLAACITEAEAAYLRRGKVDEQTLQRVLESPRWCLYHDMPKGAPEALMWRFGPAMIPAHD